MPSPGAAAIWCGRCARPRGVSRRHLRLRQGRAGASGALAGHPGRFDGGPGGALWRRQNHHVLAVAASSTTLMAVRCWWTASTCATLQWSRCGRPLASCSKTCTCSAARCAITSLTVAPVPPTRRLWRRPARPTRWSSSRGFPTVSTRWWGSGARVSPAVKSSASPLPACSCATLAFSFWTKPPAPSDNESERAIQASLAQLSEGRTTVIIAHRLSTIRGADLIAVVEEGRVVEQGTHDQLLAADGTYARYYRMQFGE